MTNKITIDGIDVSECCYFNSDEVYPCELYNNNCNDQNCYYQQLKHKEQECEEKEKYISLLESGYGKLTEIVSPYMSDFTGYNEDTNSFDVVQCVQELLQEQKQIINEYRKENENYKQALDEIEKQCKCYARSAYTQEFDRIYGGNLDTNILEIIEEAKGRNKNDEIIRDI